MSITTSSNSTLYSSRSTSSSLYYHPSIPLQPTLSTKHYTAPPTLNETIQKLQALQEHKQTILQFFKTSKDYLQHLAYVPNAGTIITKKDLEHLNTPCSMTDTFLSLWRIVPCKPTWNHFSPMNLIKKKKKKDFPLLKQHGH